jgi:hypothetical protein
MSSYGKMNLLVMLGLPVVAVLTSMIMFGVRSDTVVFVFGINIVPMLIGGLISGLLLRSVNKAGGSGQFMAVSPTLIPAIFGGLWYLYSALLSADPGAGREYIAAPIYMVIGALVIGVVAWVGCMMTRSAQAVS